MSKFEISISAKDLSDTIRGFSSVLGANTLPGVGDLLLEAKDGSLSISATDREAWISGKISATVLASGSIAVPGSALLNLVGKLGDRKINFTLAKTRLNIESEGIKYTLGTNDIENFPALPEPMKKGSCSIKINPKELISALDFCLPCAGINDSRQYLNGISLRLLKHDLVLETLHGHMLARQLIAVKIEGDFPDKSIILPRKIMPILREILSAAGDDVIFTLSETAFGISGSTDLYSRLIDGVFPNIENLIPKDIEKCLVIPVQEFEKSIGRLSVITVSDKSGIKIEFSDKALISKRSDNFDGQETVTLTRKLDEPFSTTVNEKYFLTMLDIFDDEEVCMFYRPEHPIHVFKATDEPLTLECRQFAAIANMIG